MSQDWNINDSLSLSDHEICPMFVIPAQLYEGNVSSLFSKLKHTTLQFAIIRFRGEYMLLQKKSAPEFYEQLVQLISAPKIFGDDYVLHAEYNIWSQQDLDARGHMLSTDVRKSLSISLKTHDIPSSWWIKPFYKFVDGKA